MCNLVCTCKLQGFLALGIFWPGSCFIGRAVLSSIPGLYTLYASGILTTTTLCPDNQNVSRFCQMPSGRTGERKAALDPLPCVCMNVYMHMCEPYGRIYTNAYTHKLLGRRVGRKIALTAPISSSVPLPLPVPTAMSRDSSSH